MVPELFYCVKLLLRSDFHGFVLLVAENQHWGISKIRASLFFPFRVDVLYLEITPRARDRRIYKTDGIRSDFIAFLS